MAQRSTLLATAAIFAAGLLIALSDVRVGGAAGAGRPGAAADAGDAKEAQSRLRAAIRARDVAAMQKAAVAIAKAGGAAQMKYVLGLLGKVPADEDAVYWALLTGVASFVDRPALEALGKYIRDNAKKPLVRDLLYGLADNPSADCVAAIVPVLRDGPDDLRLLAATKLSRIHAPEAVDALIELVAKEERARDGAPSDLAWLAAEGLTAMTGQEFGPVAVNWEGWWKQNRDKPLRSARDAVLTASTGTAVDSLRGDRLRREGFLGVENAPKEAVVVLSAIYTKELQRDLNNDHMEAVCQSMRIPHTVVRREDFLGYDLSQAGIVLVNCAQFHRFCICPTCKPGGAKNNRLYQCEGCDKHIPFSAELKPPEVEKLANFVKSGGFVFAEDWVVQEVVERAFPSSVSAGVKLSQSTVDVVPARGMGTHPYLRGIFSPRAVDGPRPAGRAEEEGGGEELASEDEWLDDEEDDLPWEIPERRTIVLDSDGVEIGADGVRVKHTWTIDDESYSLKIGDSRRVLRLLASGKLQKVAEGQGVVALAFRPGSSAPIGHRAPAGTPGVVVCVLSHFGKQVSMTDEYAIQNLLLNVLIDAESARRGRVAGRGRR